MGNLKRRYVSWTLEGLDPCLDVNVTNMSWPTFGGLYLEAIFIISQLLRCHHVMLCQKHKCLWNCILSLLYSVASSVATPDTQHVQRKVSGTENTYIQSTGILLTSTTGVEARRILIGWGHAYTASLLKTVMPFIHLHLPGIPLWLFKGKSADSESEFLWRRSTK